MARVDNQCINRRVTDIMEIIRARPSYLNDKQAVETLTKAVVEGNKLKRESSDEGIKSTSATNSLIFGYVQFLLHFSFAIELKLVADDFVKEQREFVGTVIDYLDEIVSLLQPLRESVLSASDDSKVKELLECAYWRKGALLYMLCHTLYNQPRYLDHASHRSEFVSYCKGGVISLAQDMRAVRHRDAQLQYTASDAQLIELVKEGIFSDTNMLAIMYAAEMCYWIDLTKDEDIHVDLDARSLGEQLANQYIRIAEGPLKDTKWNISQAHVILKHCRQ